MKTKFFLLLISAVVFLAAYSSVIAQAGMPQMGATDEIKALSWLVGEWDVASEFRMDPKQDWMKSTATAVYKYSVDGCVLEMDYTSDIMGMKYFGKLIETYDRKNKQYQAVWIDNMAARMSYTTGNKVADSTILSGIEKMPDGSEVISRVITYNETKTSFDWQIDMSNDGGKTFWTNGRAKYTKKK